MANEQLDQISNRLKDLAEHYDCHSCWPQRSIDLIAQAGCWRWIIPEQWGGDQLGELELVQAYESVARGCLATALILTQRDGAVDLVARGENDALKEKLLPEYAHAHRFTSIGIAQLTTSKRGSKPQLTATPKGKDFILEGNMPWVTGAVNCDEIVTGAVLPDGKQLIASISAAAAGLVIDPPMRLMALEASCTCRVRCLEVRVTPEDVIRGPSDSGLSMRTPVKPLVTVSVGLGLAASICDGVDALGDSVDPALRKTYEPLREAYANLRNDVYTAAQALGKGQNDVDAQALRERVNTLNAQLGMTYLTISKGSGYAHPHPAERLMREAMFFLVWSIPTDVQAQTLNTLCIR